MPVKPNLQPRHFDYVFGPNQDPRLASVAAGATIEKLVLRLDSDAPFLLCSRAVRLAYPDATINQNGLQFLKTRWAGPVEDYRQQVFVPERLQLANYGQAGQPGPVFPPIIYPAGGVITLDIYNSGASALTNLSFYWRGVKLYPWGTVPGYSYPSRMASLPFSYPIPTLALAGTETRYNQMFTVKPDADFVVRGIQALKPSYTAGPPANTLANVSIILRDFDTRPYSNDFVPLDILAGSQDWPATMPVGPSPNYYPVFPAGPAQPGLFYPEIYVPANHQLTFDIQRADGVNPATDYVFNLIGAKVFKR